MSLVLSNNLLLTPPTLSNLGSSPNAPLIGWQSHVAIDSVSSDFENEDFPIVNLANDSTALEWRSSSTDDQYIQVEIPPGEYVDYVGIATHNLASTGTAISVETLSGEEEWTEIFEPVLLRDNYPAILRFEQTYTSAIRIKLSGATDFPAISVMYVGALLMLPRNIYVGHSPINYARSTQVSNGKNEAGDFLGRIVLRRSKNTGLTLSNLPPDWFRTEFEPFMYHAETKPFFFAWRPFDYPFEIGYAWTTDDIQSSNQLPNGFMQFSANIGAIAGRGGVAATPRPKLWVLEKGYWSNQGYWRTDLKW